MWQVEKKEDGWKKEAKIKHLLESMQKRLIDREKFIKEEDYL